MTVRSVLLRIGVGAIGIAAILLSPAGAFAASATVTVAPASGGGLSVAANVTVDQSDCSSAYGGCDWFIELTDASGGQSCTTYDAGELAGVGALVETRGVSSLSSTVDFFEPGPYDICAFAWLGADDSETYLGSTTYSPPPATGSMSVGAQSGGRLDGTVSAAVPFCEGVCAWSVNVYEQDGSGACSSGPSGTLASVGSDQFVLGTATSPYSFTPDVSSGTLQLCAYLNDALLIASSSYTFPAPRATVNKKPVIKPKLLVAMARLALRRALVKRIIGARNLELSCGSLSRTKVRCAVSLKRSGVVYQGPATALLTHSIIHMTWTLKPVAPVKKPTPTTTTPTTTPTTPAASCTPLSNEGTCYEPGEYCRENDHGLSGVAGDGEAITCEDNDGWRWEPTG
jgi:hypothetical protein